MITKSSLYFLVLSYFILFNIPYATASSSKPDLKIRAEKLMQEIKCPTCQGQSIYDSQTEVAYQLRMLVEKQMKQGATNDAIKNQLKERYGDVILFDPPYTLNTCFLWLGPFIMIMGLGVFIFKRLKKVC